VDWASVWPAVSAVVAVLTLVGGALYWIIRRIYRRTQRRARSERQIIQSTLRHVQKRSVVAYPSARLLTPYRRLIRSLQVIKAILEFAVKNLDSGSEDRPVFLGCSKRAVRFCVLRRDGNVI
jgi:hypothetical protein